MMHASFSENGIEVIAPEYANSNLDMPTVPADIMKVFNGNTDIVILMSAEMRTERMLWADILPIFKRGIFHAPGRKRKTSAYQNKNEILDMASEIEKASRLKITDIINNTNIGKLFG